MPFNKIEEKFTVVLRRENGHYSAFCPELDIAGEGSTRKQARTHLQEEIETYLLGCNPDDLEKMVWAERGRVN